MAFIIFSWNCQGKGAASHKFCRVLRSFIKDYKPNIPVLVEPRI